MFKSIVTGTDGSPEAERALKLAVEMAKADPEAEIHVVATFDPLSKEQFLRLTNFVPHPLSEAEFIADPISKNALAFMTEQGVAADVEEVLGETGDVLLAAVQRHEADLLIVGLKGEGAIRRALHGSISTRLVHSAPCPVMVVTDQPN